MLQLAAVLKSADLGDIGDKANQPVSPGEILARPSLFIDLFNLVGFLNGTNIDSVQYGKKGGKGDSTVCSFCKEGTIFIGIG